MNAHINTNQHSPSDCLPQMKLLKSGFIHRLPAALRGARKPAKPGQSVAPRAAWVSHHATLESSKGVTVSWSNLPVRKNTTTSLATVVESNIPV